MFRLTLKGTRPYVRRAFLTCGTAGNRATEDSLAERSTRVLIAEDEPHIRRLLATRLGSACADLIQQETYGVMVASRGEDAVPVPLEQVAGNRKLIPPDHSWIKAARRVGTNFGD